MEKDEAFRRGVEFAREVGRSFNAPLDCGQSEFIKLVLTTCWMRIFSKTHPLKDEPYDKDTFVAFTRGEWEGAHQSWDERVKVSSN